MSDFLSLRRYTHTLYGSRELGVGVGGWGLGMGFGILVQNRYNLKDNVTIH